MIKFSCSNCGASISVKPEYAGKRGKCPKCQQTMTIPAPEIEEEIDFQEEDEDDLPELPKYPPKKKKKTLVESQPEQADPAPASNSLGISSLVMGGMSILFFLLPYISWFFGVIGLILAGFAFMASLARSGRGIGYPIAGGSISLVGVMMALVVYVSFTGVIKDMRDQAKRRVNPDQAITKEEAAAPAPASPTSIPPAAPEWTSYENPITAGDVEVKFVKAETGKINIKNALGENTSKDQLLRVVIQITNNSKAKKLDYSGFNSSSASLRGIIAKLEDEHGNRYKSISFGFSDVIEDSPGNSESIYPGKSITEALVFELPIDAAQELRLTLKSKDLNPDGDIRLKFPSSIITAKTE